VAFTFRAAAALLVLAACSRGGSGHRISASDYDRTCSASGDCIAVFAGEISCCAGCANATIRATDRETYQKDFDARQGSCEAAACGFPAGCAGGLIICPHGTCEFHPAGAPEDDASARSVAAADYPRTCTSVADCVPVYEGQLGCCDQGCANTAIRADAMALYAADVGRRTPICYPVPPCVAPPQCPDRRVTCEGGVCGLAPAQ
jgi:hypothetical protein